MVDVTFHFQPLKWKLFGCNVRAAQKNLSAQQTAKKEPCCLKPSRKWHHGHILARAEARDCQKEENRAKLMSVRFIRWHAVMIKEASFMKTMLEPVTIQHWQWEKRNAVLIDAKEVNRLLWQSHAYTQENKTLTLIMDLSKSRPIQIQPKPEGTLEDE